MSSLLGCQCAMQNFRCACKPADTDHYRACHTTFLSAELIQESFQSNFSLSPLSLLNPLMNHEPTIPCELFRDQFRDLCKATPLAIGAVAKPALQTEQSAACNEPRQAGSVLPHKNYWAKHSVFFPQHLQKKKNTIQNMPKMHSWELHLFSGLQNKILLSKWAVKLTLENFLSKAASHMTKWTHFL